MPPEEPPLTQVQLAPEYSARSATELRRLLGTSTVDHVGASFGARGESADDLVRQLLRDRQMDRVRSLIAFVRDVVVVVVVLWFSVRLNSYLESSTMTEMTAKAVRIMANGEGASSFVIKGARDMQQSASELSTRVNHTGVEVQAAVHALTLALNRLSHAGLNVLIPAGD